MYQYVDAAVMYIARAQVTDIAYLIITSPSWTMADAMAWADICTYMSVITVE